MNTISALLCNALRPRVLLVMTSNLEITPFNFFNPRNWLEISLPVSLGHITKCGWEKHVKHTTGGKPKLFLTLVPQRMGTLITSTPLCLHNIVHIKRVSPRPRLTTTRSDR